MRCRHLGLVILALALCLITPLSWAQDSEATGEGTVTIEFLALRGRVEDAEVRRCIRTSRCAPLPTAVVRGEVTIDELLHEEPLTEAPIDQQVLGQKHGAGSFRTGYNSTNRHQCA